MNNWIIKYILIQLWITFIIYKDSFDFFPIPDYSGYLIYQE